jgi:DNA-binding GntR family transcriptional regulator
VSLDSTKADDIALVIEEAIVSGELAPGTVLRQEQLSEQFKVSRTPIREALRRLAALGLVSFVPNRGVRVRTLSREELHEAFLVRAELEGLATEAAAAKITAEQLDELDAAEKRFAVISQELRAREPGEERRTIMSDWVRANHAFHDVIYRAADLPLVSRASTSSRASTCSRRSSSRSARSRATGPRAARPGASAELHSRHSSGVASSAVRTAPLR